MNNFQVLLQALVRFKGLGVFLNAGHGHAILDTLEQAAGFASALEEGFDVDDPMPYTCPDHADEKGWRVDYYVRCDPL